MLLFSDGAGGFVDLTGEATPAPSAAIFKGQHDPDNAAFAGPLGGAGDAAFVSPNGTDLHPTGTGRWVYVDAAATGANDGTTLTDAYTTIQAAIDDHQAGDCILIEPGVYAEDTYPGGLRGPHPNPFGYTKENEATATDRVKVCRRGSGRVEITGTDPVTGWTAASDGDADGNPDWANLYYTDVTPSAEVPIGSTVLMQSGVAAAITMLGDGMSTTDDMLLPQHKSLWWDGTIIGSEISDLVKSGNTGTITITSSHFETYPQGYLDGCEIWLNLINNEVYFTTIDSHNAATGQIVFTLPGGKNWTTEQMALRNVLSEIGEPGQWGYRDNGDGSYRLWFWPYDETKMDEIRIGTRKIGINISDAENWTFYGLDVTGVGGVYSFNLDSGVGIMSDQRTSSKRTGLWFEECRTSSCLNMGFAMINTADMRVFNCTADRIIDGKGMAFDDGDRNVYAYNLSEITGSTSVSLYQQHNSAFLYNRIGEVRSVHGNGASNYLVTTGLWVHGCEFDVLFAISMTTQDSGNTYWSCNVVKLGPGVANRGLEDNSAFPAGYERWGGGATYGNVEVYFPTVPRMSWVCNSILPWVGAAASENTSAIQYGNTTRCEHYAGGNAVFSKMTYRNNTVTDTSTEPPTVYNATRAAPEAGNILVGTADSGNSILSNGQGNTLEPDPTTVWENIGDPTPKAGGPLVGSSGDHSAHLPLAEAWVATLGILDLVQRDFNGVPINYSAAPRGAVAA